jgi:N-acetylmuramoyl-L-alanine amidase
MKRLLIAAGLLLVQTLAAAFAPVELRDISVAPSGNTATITFLVGGSVGTVVLERKEGGIAEVRMKSMSATRSALASALPKPGVRSIKAHIERKDVLVADVAFTRRVSKMEVTHRDASRIEVTVTLGAALPGTSPATTASSSSTPSASKSGAGKATAKRGGAARRAWSLATIVIDAGHGGKDPGAIGIGDVQEKDVTLAVARGLRDEIRRAMPGVTVVMTRSDDSFIELFRRGQIANERNGRLFISIHCNSMPQKPDPASGFECYILRPGKNEDAEQVTAVENGAIRFEADREKYAALSAENAIMASMAQSAFVRYSELLASALRRSMKGKTAIPDRGVHQAGFYVLVGASMPSVLVEIGYLSNEKDAKVLTSTAGQKKIARALFEGIRSYEKIYSASLRE